jgi:hypothetical protein
MATGGEVAQKLQAATGGTIQQAIASNVANTVGSGKFTVSGAQSVGQPDVVEADTVSFTSTTAISTTIMTTTTATTVTTVHTVADGQCNTNTLALPSSAQGSNCPTIMNEGQSCAVGCLENYESVGSFTCSSGVLIGESVCMPISAKSKDTSSSSSPGITAIIILIIGLFLIAVVAIAYLMKTRMFKADSRVPQADFGTKYTVQSDLEVGNDAIIARVPSRTLLESPSCEPGKNPKAQEAPKAKMEL